MTKGTGGQCSVLLPASASARSRFSIRGNSGSLILGDIAANACLTKPGDRAPFFQDFLPKSELLSWTKFSLRSMSHHPYGVGAALALAADSDFRTIAEILTVYV